MPKDLEPPMHPDAGAKPPRKLRGILALAVLALLAAAAVVAVSGVLSRQRSEAKLTQWTQAQAVPTVNVVTPQHATKDQELVLPGDIEAFYEAPIYARVSGYLKMWYKDIGAKVKAGDLLALIDTPELDQQLEQAKSDLASVQAGASLANLTSKRWQALLSSNAVSQQTADEKAGDAVEKKALVAASEARVSQLQALEEFKRITAPFDGVVTARQTDIGALINAGSGSGSGAELFKVADIHQLRVYVRVPQAYSAQLEPGMTVTMRLPQYPDRTFTAKLATTSNAISKDSRKLWPGTFAEVHFALPPNPSNYRLPASALLFRKEGLQVATVGPDDKVVLKSLTVARDLGTEIEVNGGIAPTDRVIDSPSDSLAQGDAVKIANDKAATAPAALAASDKTASGNEE